MIQAIGALNIYEDPEYLIIARKLRQLGLSPSGNKVVDKERLQKAKHEEENNKEKFEFTKTETFDEEDFYNVRTQMEEERVGASTLAELNRYFLLNV